MSTEELARGPGDQSAPAKNGMWVIVAAKNEGVTPGFTIVDAGGRKYVLKFDPASNPEMASAADVISSKFFYALGYNVPENYIVTFDRTRLAIGDKTTVTDSAGKKRRMTNADLTAILDKVPVSPNGRYRAMASLYLAGQPIGPFRYHGTRRDDPNDVVPHEHRRELRGLRVFSAWLGHDDSRAINTLDLIALENGVPYIRHHLIDFGATLGSASFEPNSPRSGNEYLFAWRPAAAKLFSLGLYAPQWQRARYPDLPSVGRFESAVFDPERWATEYPNPAFVNMNPDDAFWAAKQVMAFTDEQIAAIVGTGEYSDPAAADWVTRCLIERRDKIGKAYFEKVLPLDQFTLEQGRLRFEDLSARLDIGRKTYRVQWSLVDNRTGRRSALPFEDSFEAPHMDARPGTRYLVAEIIGQRPNQFVSVYLRAREGRLEIVGIERTWNAVRKG
jgi:hypothetical protein